MQESIFQQIRSIASRSGSDRVFIVGKGPSADLVDFTQLPPGLVINLNDSERVHRGDIGIFSANWVRHSLRDGGFSCAFYLAGKPLPSEVPHEVLPPVPLELDHDDLNVMRLEREEFFDESFVLLNAFKAALVLKRELGKPIDVYLLGFDFTTHGASLSRKVGRDYSGAEFGEREAIIAAQEHKFLQIFHYFEEGDRLRLHHVGSKEFSDLSPATFAQRVCGSGERKGGYQIRLQDPDRVLIVAEFTNNHLGDANRLIEMVERSKEAGADLIKVQKRDVDSFYSSEKLASYYWSPFGETLGDYRRGVELTDEMFDLLDETCREFEIEWFCSVLDMPSFRRIQRFDPRLVKIPSTISNHREFHQQLASEYAGGLVASTGFTEWEYIDHLLETFVGNEFIYLLHCVSAYPAPREACNLAVVRRYYELGKSDGRILPGYSSHDLGALGCMLAASGGARMLEKHVKLGDVDWIHFDKVAIDLRTEEFARFVRDIRIAEEALGSESKKVYDCENHKYPVQ